MNPSDALTLYLRVKQTDAASLGATYTVSDMARELDVTRQSLSGWIAGDHNPSWETACSIERATQGVMPARLLARPPQDPGNHAKESAAQPLGVS